MENNITFRSFKEGDYETCCEWWWWWWKRHGKKPVRRAFLPSDEKCFIIEKDGVPVAAYFLFLSDVRIVGWTTYLVSNPKYKEKDRRDLIELLITKVEKEAEKHGVMQLFTVCGDNHVSSIHHNLDWLMFPAKYEGFKFLMNNIKIEK